MYPVLSLLTNIDTLAFRNSNGIIIFAEHSKESMGEFLQIIFYGGAFQGLLLSVFLFSITTNKISNRLLAILTMCWGIVLLAFALQEKGLYQKFPQLAFVFDQLIFLFFPLLYLQVKYLLTSHTSFHKKDLLHFIPFVLGIILYMDFFLRPADQKIELFENRSPYYQVIEIILNEVISVQGIVYSILAIMLIRIYQAKIKDYVSSAQKNIIKILYVGISLNLLSWTMGIIDVHLRYFNIEIGIDLFAITYLILVLVIYAISYAALKSPEIFKLELSSEKSHSLDFRSLVRGSKESGKTKLSQASDETISGQSTAFDPGLKKLNQQLIDFMEKQKPYLNPELSLPALAQELDQPRNQLSSVINQVHQKNFYEFVNEYRVDEVKQLMTDPANKHLKLISLAYDAGFNSKASFNRIFKQMTKMTPSQYVTKQQAN